jgi:integrase
VELFKRKNSNCWWYDFTVRGERYRGSTKERNKTAASAKAARLLTEITDDDRPVYMKKSPVLSVLAERFMSFLNNAKLEEKSKIYLRSGWRLLQRTDMTGMRIDRITSENIDTLVFPGGPYNVNCALKTLRRMLHKGQEWGLISKIPKIKLMKEFGRTLRLTDETEVKLLSAYAQLAQSGEWSTKQYQLLCDITILVRDTGMRNKKELFAIRIENLDFNNRMIFVPDSKTPTGRRYVPMTDRISDMLAVRCAVRKEGWLFEAKSKSGHLTTVDKKFRQARELAGLPKKLVLYCGRHDYGTRLLQATGNLALVMKAMGQTSTKAAMEYQHPDLEQVRHVLNGRAAQESKRVQ